MIEENEMRQASHAFPGERCVAEIRGAHRRELGAIGPNLRVATHAHRNRRHAGRRRALHVRMTVSAGDAVVANVMPMIELHGLRALFADAGDVGRSLPRQQRYGHRDHPGRSECQRKPKNSRAPSWK
jgi:hypothetical protein